MLLRCIYRLTAGIAVIIAAISCGRVDKTVQGHLRPGDLPDTLRVATLYSPTSYFIYREEPMGVDYTLVARLADDKKMNLRIVTASSMASMIGMLDSGLVDLAAYPIPVTGEYRGKVIPCGPRSETYQVLVQPRRSHTALITDVTELPKHDVYVEQESKYYYRMLNLNDELGGGISIHPIDRDTLIGEDLIEMVSDGTIPLTVIDSDIARLNRTYYPNLDVSLPLSFAQRHAWGVSVKYPWLADSIDTWMNQKRPRDARERLLRRYFELAKETPASPSVNLTKGRISPYDRLFREAAATIDYDWRLLAAQGFIESHFDSTRVSWAGAKGIMQIMPSTARSYRQDPDSMVIPRNSIHTATLIIRDLEKSLSRLVTDEEERIKFVLGAYNSGLAHVYDAIALAGKLGYDPQVWDNNVAECLLLKANPEYYNDPVCKYGYFRGRQTTTYVDQVTAFYTRCKQYIAR